MNGQPNPQRVMQQMGCLMFALTLMFLCVLPWVLADAAATALAKLGLSGHVALMAVMGILLGGLVNIPVHRIEREDEQIVDFGSAFGFPGFMPRLRRVRRDTIVALNVGGCLVPTAIAAWQVLRIVQVGGWPLAAMVIVAAVNVLVCYRVARPVEGIGIAMPGFASPLVCVLLTWALLGPSGFGPGAAGPSAPVAFVAGVMGPLVGADLLHLKDITKVSAGMLSIGGAGTFDGIVLSGLLAALLV